MTRENGLKAKQRRKAGPNVKKNRVKRAKDLERAKRRLAELIQFLGGKCHVCGEDNPTLLSVDHVRGIKWKRSDYRFDARVGRYWRELDEGIELRVLCMPCNSKDGRARQLAEQNAEEAPF